MVRSRGEAGDAAARAERLTTTSYAVLGLLAVRPWTGYELSRQIPRSLQYCWPRTGRLLFREPKRLVRMGFADAVEDRTGGRRRTVFGISATGRAALAAWHRTRPEPAQLQFEALLRVLFADQGSKEDVVRSLDATREQVRELQRAGLEQVRDYLETGGPFPDRLHVNALFASFVSDFLLLVSRWCDEAQREIASWPGTRTVGMTEGARGMLEAIVARTESALGDG